MNEETQQEAQVKTGSTIIALIPDETYAEHRPNVYRPHLTLGFMGWYEDPDCDEMIRIRKVAADTAAYQPVIDAKVNGRGFFDITNDKGRKFAVVDLVDGFGILGVRNKAGFLGEYYGAEIDTYHGFTPHITQCYTDDNQIWGAGAFNAFDFKFTKLAVWNGNKEWEYDLL